MIAEVACVNDLFIEEFDGIEYRVSTDPVIDSDRVRFIAVGPEGERREFDYSISQELIQLVSQNGSD